MRHKRKVWTWVLTAAWLAGFSAATRGQEQVSPPPLPFSTGEVLLYEIRWKPPLFFMPSVRAGLTTLRVEPETVYEGRRALHFKAGAKSDGFLPRLGGIDVDDTFDSIVSADDFCTRKITKIQREGKRKRDIVVTMDPERRSAHITEIDIATVPPRVLRDEELPVEGCVSDVVAIFYAARRLDLQVGKTYPMLLNDNGTTRPVTVSVEKREEVETGAGTVAALRIHTGSAMGLISRGGTFVVWYSDDALKVPVRFEASVRFGKVFGSLKSFQGKGKLQTITKPGN